MARRRITCHTVVHSPTRGEGMANPDDYAGIDGLVVVAVPHPDAKPDS
jgi:hypothetical protein